MFKPALSEEDFRTQYGGREDAVFVEDFNGKVLNVNQKACSLHGKTRDELIGASVFDLVPPRFRDEVRRGFVKLVKGEWSFTHGHSYTEKEYDYATKQGKPILAFVHRHPEDLPAENADTDLVTKAKLQRFREKIGRHIIKYWETRDELKEQVMIGLVNAIDRYPAEGWVRGASPGEASPVRPPRNCAKWCLGMAVVALIGVVWGVSWLTRPPAEKWYGYYGDLIDNDQHYVASEELSLAFTSDPELNCQRVTGMATGVVLEQGQTKTDKVWRIEGFRTEKYFAVAYAERDRIASGTGVYFLKEINAKTYVGFWYGLDTNSTKALRGPYVLSRVPLLSPASSFGFLKTNQAEPIKFAHEEAVD